MLAIILYAYDVVSEIALTLETPRKRHGESLKHSTNCTSPARRNDMTPKFKSRYVLGVGYPLFKANGGVTVISSSGEEEVLPQFNDWMVSPKYRLELVKIKERAK